MFLVVLGWSLNVFFFFFFFLNKIKTIFLMNSFWPFKEAVLTTFFLANPRSGQLVNDPQRA